MPLSLKSSFLVFPLLLSTVKLSATPPDAKVEAALHANNRGVAYMTRGEFAKAQAQFQEASDDDPRLVEAQVNLGIAFYEAGKDQNARRVLGKVLLHAPHDLHAHYVLGLIHKNHGEYEEAVKEFQQVLVSDTRDKSANYYAGLSLFHLRRYDEAVRHYERALEIDPDDVSAVFGLSNTYRAKGEAAKAQVYLRRYQDLRKRSPLNKPAGQEYGDEGQYSLAEDVVPPGLSPAAQGVPVHFVDVTAASGIHFHDQGSTGAAALGSGACVIEEGDARPDVLLVNGNGAPALYHNLGNGRFSDITASAGLSPAVHGAGCAVGDYDNDGKPDLLLADRGRLWLWHNEGQDRFRDVTAKVGLQSKGDHLAAALIDLDHDGFLDIVVTDAAPDGKVRAFHNTGTGRFTEISARTRLGQQPGGYRGLAATDYDNHHDIDVVLARAHGPAAIFSNQRDGTFKEVMPWEGNPANDARGVVTFDFNHDGRMDLFFTRASGAPVLLRATGTKRFRVSPLPADNRQITAGWGATALDFDNDGYPDLAFIAEVRGKTVLRLYRNRGDGSFEDVTHRTGLDAIPVHDARGLIAADFDGDGATDLLVTQAGGPPILLRNVGGNANHSVRIALAGLKDNKQGVGSKLTLRADGLHEFAEVQAGSGYLGQNATSVTFGLGQQSEADSLRVLWPTGVEQEEFPGHVPSRLINELDRKGGSCPTLYSWDGRQFRFIADIIGPGVVGEWNASAIAPGVGRPIYDRPQPSECLKLPKDAVALRNGSYEFRFANQLEEVIYLDRARLTVVDHPADSDVFSNDIYQPIGPVPQRKYWTVRNLRLPRAASDESGADLLPQLRGVDGRYAPIHARSQCAPFVGRHSLILDLGDLSGARGAQLVAHGWTEYYFPTTVWTALQAGLDVEWPSLSVPDGHGGWRKAIASIGLPGGLPRPVVIDLSKLLREGAFPRGDYRVKIDTNLAIYWDQILVNVQTPDPQAPIRIHHLEASRADLRFLGYPREVRRSPESYDYNQRLRDVGFHQLDGNYTRYGDVRALLTATDDQYVIMASGDEVALRFDAAALPSLPAGWTRSFFFCADGFTKATDFYDALPDRVTPLPLHGLKYPTPARTPESLEHLRYRLKYNTRHIVGGRAPEVAQQQDAIPSGR